MELAFKIENKEIIVKRTLKKTKDRVAQGPGFIILDGIKSDLMPREIKAKIFELLSYPKSILAKAQDLIYRFTVYTPQEDMKKIIYEDKDTRLDTLRKVFNIDKYKIIQENATIYIRKLKERRSNFEGQIIDLEGKKKKEKEIKEKIETLDKELQNKQLKFEEKQKGTQEKKKILKDTEKALEKHNEYKRKLGLLELDLKNEVEKREKDKSEIDNLQKSVLMLRQELKDFRSEPHLNSILEDKERRIETLEKELNSKRNEKSELKGMVVHLKEQSDKVKKLDNCPLCLQKVTISHKEEIIKKSNKDISKIKERFESMDSQEKEMESNLIHLKRETRELTERISLNKVLELKKVNLLEKQERLFNLKEGLDSSKQKIAKINQDKLKLGKLLDNNLEKKYAQQKIEFEESLTQERKQELELNGTKKDLEAQKNEITNLQLEIKQKELIKSKLKNTITLQNWMEDKFINLIINIEKHVMLTVFHEFNELFKQWFSMLIEDENINVRLDDTFSCIVEQDGYETEIQNLSGGEKTSVALSYRLALNRVINDVVSEIKTKDLLILDEPTEGFSTTQLDKVRDVLSEIGTKQIIIVSHENKIESFVDNVIRVTKAEGMSTAI